jgi:hypothetical protein
MPELAAAFSVGFIACWLLMSIFLVLVSRRRRSPEFLLLGKNLRQLNLYWSESTDQILPWSEEALETERKASRKSIILMGGLLSLFSWIGFVLILILMVSYRFLARSRLEKTILSSSLAQTALAPAEVKKLLMELAPGAVLEPSETKRP